MFTEWCKKNNVFTQDSKVTTHLLLNGGKLCITNNIMDEFYQIYSKSLQLNEDLYLVEKVSSKLNYFLDIDCKSNSNIDFETLINDIDDIFKIQKYIYKCNKTNGYHIIFPTQQSTPSECIKLTKDLILKLNKNYNYCEEMLKQIIDCSVYKTGLRMIGSYKKDDHRYYTINNTNRTQLTKEDIKNSSIRFSNINIDLKFVPRVVHYNDNLNSLLSKEIEHFNKNYKDIKVTKIEKINNDLFCINTDSHFCLNKNSNHTKEVVYFVVSKKKIQQKCYSSNGKTENMTHNCSCLKFKSREVPFSHRIYNMLLQSY